jgi:hypothetical protein
MKNCRRPTGNRKRWILKDSADRKKSRNRLILQIECRIETEESRRLLKVYENSEKE